jgi:hypothetical protein
MRDTRVVWQDTFDEVVERTGDSFLASKEADEAVADFLARQTDEIYDHWRDVRAYAEEA